MAGRSIRTVSTDFAKLRTPEAVRYCARAKEGAVLAETEAAMSGLFEPQPIGLLAAFEAVCMLD